MKHTLSYIKKHPNPSWTRPDWIDLNGKWDFKFDYQNLGLAEQWFKGFKTDLKINVPYSYQSKKSNITYEKEANVIWYQRTINIKPKKNKRVLLHLEGSDFLTQVFLNGQQVASFTGGYHRHSVDITEYLEAEKTRLVFRIEDSFNAEQPRGKQRWKTPSYECFYVETSGIYKSVWLEYVGNTFVETAKLTPDSENFLLNANFRVNGSIAGLVLETKILFDDIVVNLSKTKLIRNNFAAAFDITTDHQTMKLFFWHPDYPNLYDVVFTLYHDNKIIDQVTTYFGVTKWASVGKNIYLNHSPLYLKMILDQGYFGEGHLTATEEQLKNDVIALKDLGFNGARKHEKIEDQRFSYYADILGLVQWVEMPSFYEFSDQAIEYTILEWQQILQQYYNHPSIMSWITINESWGTMSIYDSDKQINFVKSMFNLTKAIDSSRFVISNDGWEHVKSDIITLHNYRESYQELSAAYKNIIEVLTAKEANSLLSKTPLSKDAVYQNQPLILSEFGGIAIENDSGWGYGKKVSDGEMYLSKLENQLKAIKENPYFAGFCLTQLTDVQQETNGIFTEERTLKIDRDKLKELINQFK